MGKILLVEDDKSFGYVLSEYMQLKGYDVIWMETAKEGIDALSKNSFELAILDINLKNATGFDVAQTITNDSKDLPFIFLTARDLKIDQLKGYQYGAEEFITKPIDEEILLAKIEAILSRNRNTVQKNEEIIWKGITLNCNRRELMAGKDSFQLTERECHLMETLLSQPETLVERKVILKNLWDSQDEFSRNSMDVYISRLRKYLSASEVNIRNVHGKGFVLE